MRWLLASIGLVIGVAALYLLLASEPDAPLDDIDAASRAKLEQVLRDSKSERGERGASP